MSTFYFNQSTESSPWNSLLVNFTFTGNYENIRSWSTFAIDSRNNGPFPPHSQQ